MPNTLKRLGDDEIRFDCECGRIHLISSDGPDGKYKIETILKTPKGKQADDPAGQTDSGDAPKKGTPPPTKKGFFDGIL